MRGVNYLKGGVRLDLGVDLDNLLEEEEEEDKDKYNGDLLGTTRTITQLWRDCLTVKGRRIYISRGRSVALRGRGGVGTTRVRFPFGCA